MLHYAMIHFLKNSDTSLEERRDDIEYLKSYVLDTTKLYHVASGNIVFPSNDILSPKRLWIESLCLFTDSEIPFYERNTISLYHPNPIGIKYGDVIGNNKIGYALRIPYPNIFFPIKMIDFSFDPCNL
jgi:hypothetical protein